MSQTYTTADVAKHKDAENGFWLIVENDVYDVTSKDIPSLPTMPPAARLPSRPRGGLADGRHSPRGLCIITCEEPSCRTKGLTRLTAQTSSRSTPAARRSSSGSRARTRPRHSGSTTTSTCSRSTARSSRSGRWARARSYKRGGQCQGLGRRLRSFSLRFWLERRMALGKDTESSCR